MNGTGAVVGRPKRKRPEGGGGVPQQRHIGMRATEAWATWAERGAAHCRTDLAKAIDAALVEYFRARGYTEPPPPRY